MSRANRWFLYGPLLAFGVFLIVWGILWRSGAAKMRASLADFATTAEASGVAVSYGNVKTRGFPFYLRGVVSGFSATRGSDRYDCAALAIDALPYAPDRIIFSCGGVQSLTTRGDVWTLSGVGARASVESDRERGWIAKAETGAFAADNGRERISVERALINIAPSASNAASLEGSVRLIGIAAPLVDVERLDAAFTLAPKGVDGARTLAVDGVEILGEDTEISAVGEFLLQDGTPLTGRLDAIIKKPTGLARAFEKAGMIDPQGARTAEAGLAMLAVAGGGTLRAPIDLAADEIRVAGVRVAKRKPSAQP